MLDIFYRYPSPEFMGTELRVTLTTLGSSERCRIEEFKEESGPIVPRDAFLGQPMGVFPSLLINPFFPTVPTFAVRETASLDIMGAPRVPPLNPS